MSGTTLNLSLSEGVSVSTPSQGSTLPVYANDAAYVTAKGSSAVAGDEYFSSSTLGIRAYNGTTWAAVGSSGSSGINYLSSNPDAEIDTSGWATYADAAATTPVDGTGGSPSSTLTRSTVTPLRGTASFLWTKTAVNRQGEGFSYAFTIDSADKAKIINISFDYTIASGTYADGDMIVYIYDVTNAALIQPAGMTITGGTVALPLKKTSCTFQTASNSVSYRLIVHTSTTSASAYTVEFDTFLVGPQTSISAPAISDWASYTPTFKGDSNGSSFTNVTTTGYWRRVGDSMEVEIESVFSGAIATGTGSFVYGMPLGYLYDSTKMGAAIGSACLGVATALKNSNGFSYTGAITGGAADLSPTNGIVLIQSVAGTGNWGLSTPISWTTSDKIGLRFIVPIVGWSSNSVASSDSDTRVIAALVTGDPASATSGNPIIVPTVIFDLAGGYNATTGRYTTSVPGIFKMYGALQSASSATTLSIYKNAVLYCLAGNLDSNGESTFAGSVLCNSGDLIDIRPGGTVDASNMSLNIERTSGPSVITATESVQCSYYTSASGTVSTTQDFNFDTKIYDSHNAVTASAAGTGTWKFSPPVSGIFSLNVNAVLGSTSSNYITVFKNGSYYDDIGCFTGDVSQNGHGSYDIRLLSTDYISIRLGASKTWAGGALSADHCGIQIKRVGNY